MNKFISVLIVTFCLIACTSNSQGDVKTTETIIIADVINTVVTDVTAEDVGTKEEAEVTSDGAVVNLGGITGKLPVDKYNSKYDVYFQKYGKRFFGAPVEWRYFKAQAVAESALNPNAVSPVGARSLMQVMPRTWDEIIKLNSFIENDPFNPRWAIAAGISYDKRLWDMWKSKRTELNRFAIVFGSYNAGAGNLLKSQKLCLAAGADDCNNWSGIRAFADKVTTWKAAETKGYVKRIFGYMGHNGW